MAEPSASLSIDRSGLSLTALTISGDDSEPLSIVSYQAPMALARVTYAAPSPWLHGSTATSAVLDHTAMSASVRAEGATEAALAALETELRNALGQFTYEITETTNGVARVWRCDMGSIRPVERDYADLRRFVAYFEITIPVYPIAS